MPRTIWRIGFEIFAHCASELMLAGILPDMAADLGVTIRELDASSAPLCSACSSVP
jgi:predicted MFS family arabinose efflux permease